MENGTRVKTDRVTLTIPGSRSYYGVVHLVLGGLASRHELTIENFDDLLLALDGVLDRQRTSREITVVLSVGNEEIEARVGPFDGDTFGDELEREPGDEMSLRRLLDAVVDSVRVEQGEDGEWIELRKAVRPASEVGER